MDQSSVSNDQTRNKQTNKKGMDTVSPSPMNKQENRGSSPSLPMVSVKSGRQTTTTVSSAAQQQLPLVSLSTQEDLYHLPGRLRINPSLWDKEDVNHWLHWAQKEYCLRRPEKGHFEMNGRALCLLTKEDFRRRCPSSGDVLYELLQCVKQHRTGATGIGSPLNSSAHGANTQANTSHIQTPSNHKVQGPQAHTTDGNQVSTVYSNTMPVATVSSVTSQPEPTSPLRDHPPRPSQNTHTNVSTPGCTCPHVQPCPNVLGLREEPLNLSNQLRPRSPPCEANGRIPECKLLWDYVYHLLCDQRYHDYIRWDDQDTMVFRVVDPNGLARLWGNHKNRINMTYEKMSRALRHYYKLNIIKKEPGQKLTFRFLKTPKDIRTHFVGVYKNTTPPRDGNTLDHHPSYEFNEDNLEVSPEPASPPSELQ